MSTFATRFAAGVAAFDLLTGAIDKDKEKAKIRDGYAALLEWVASGVSLATISKTVQRSKNQITRDNTAAETLARFPKADPVVVVKACNVLTKATVEKCDSVKALAEAAKEKAGDTAKGRKARGSVDQTQKAGKAAKTVKGEQRPMTPQDVVALMRSGRLLPANGWDANGYDLISTEAAIQRDALRKAAQAVAKTA